MKCPKCKTDDAIVGTLSRTWRPLLVKGGGIKITNEIRMTQGEARQFWDASVQTIPDTDEKYHPVSCNNCRAEFWYVFGGQGLVAPGASDEAVANKPSTVQPREGTPPQRTPAPKKGQISLPLRTPAPKKKTFSFKK